MAMCAYYVAELTGAPGAGGGRALDNKRTHAVHLHLHRPPIWIWWAIGVRAHACAIVRLSISIAWIQLLPVRSIELELFLFKNSSTLLCLHANLIWCGACKIKLKMQKQELKRNRIQTYIRRLRGSPRHHQRLVPAVNLCALAPAAGTALVASSASMGMGSPPIAGSVLEPPIR